MENNASLHNSNVDHLKRRVGFFDGVTLGTAVQHLFIQSRPHESLAEVFDEEGDENASHEDGGGRPFIINALETVILEH